MTARKSVDQNARQLERRYRARSSTALGERDEVDCVKCARGAGVCIVVDGVRSAQRDRKTSFAHVERPTRELSS
jgi:hypothetical protein